MKRNVIPIRGSLEEHARWKEAAGSETFSAWARRVLNEAADHQNAVEAETDELKRKRLDEIVKAFPQGEVTSAALGAAQFYSGKKSYKPDPR